MLKSFDQEYAMPHETPVTITRQLADTDFAFYAWVLSWAVLGAVGALHAMYAISSFVPIAVFLVLYVWIYMLAKLDQLAGALGKSPSLWVYGTLVLPVIGTIMGYYVISRIAVQKSESIAI